MYPADDEYAGRPGLPMGGGRLELDQPPPREAGPDPLDRIEAEYDLADWWLS